MICGKMKKLMVLFIQKIQFSYPLGPSKKNLNNYYSLGDLTT